MPAVVPLELSPEEQSFFDAGEQLDTESGSPAPGASQRQGHHGPHGRRRSWRRLNRRIRRKIRERRWGKPILFAFLTVAAVGVGYKASMIVASQGEADAFSLEASGR